MATLAASAVTTVRGWTEGDVTGKRRSCRELVLVLTGQGGTTDIPASVLGFTKIEEATPAMGDGDDHIYVTSPSYLGTYLYIKASATDAPHAGVTDTVRLTVKGWL